MHKRYCIGKIKVTPYSPEKQTGENPIRKEKGVINQTILPLVPEGATPINEILSVWRDDSRWTYFIGSYPIYSHACDDLRMFRLTAAQLIDTGNCRACEIIKTCGVSKSSINRVPLPRRRCRSLLQATLSAWYWHSHDSGSDQAGTKDAVLI